MYAIYNHCIQHIIALCNANHCFAAFICIAITVMEAITANKVLTVPPAIRFLT